MKLVKFVLAIVAFPFVWLGLYLARIVWFDLVGDIIGNLLYLRIFRALFSVLYYPVLLLWEIPVGLVVTFITSFDVCKNIACISDRS